MVELIILYVTEWSYIKPRHELTLNLSLGMSLLTLNLSPTTPFAMKKSGLCFRVMTSTCFRLLGLPVGGSLASFILPINCFPWVFVILAPLCFCLVLAVFFFLPAINYVAVSCRSVCTFQLGHYALVVYTLQRQPRALSNLQLCYYLLGCILLLKEITYNALFHS